MSTPGDVLDTLIQDLKNQDDDHGYSTALKMTEFGATGVPKLIRGLESPHGQTRKWCARTLSNLVGGYGDYSGRTAVMTASEPILAALVKEKDARVKWYMVQAVETIRPDSARAIPVLIDVLKVNDDKLQTITVEAIGRYRQAAIVAKPRLCELLKTSVDDSLRLEILSALESIGVTSPDAEMISKLDLSNAPYATWHAVRILFSYPEDALRFLQLNPNALVDFDSGNLLNTLVSVLKDGSQGNSQLRDYLRNRHDLPSIAMVYIGEESYLPVILDRIGNAKPHSRTFLEACARALGANPTTMIKLSAADPGGFRPKSAHPGTDDDRWADGNGHGDGHTSVLITGKLVMSDGSPVKAPKFFHANDRWLLQQARKDPAPLLRFDESTGRFVFHTSVFAAYSMAKGQKEPGPYQTGDARTVIEAEGATPLEVIFYDEMPDVEITLTPK